MRSADSWKPSENQLRTGPETIGDMEQPATERRVIRKARQNRAEGRVVRVDLGDGRHAYGRQLWSINVEFYDHVDTAGKTIELLDLVDKPVAFTIWLTDRCFQRNGRWTLLDTIPLLDRERQRSDVKFRQDMPSGALTIESRPHPPSLDFRRRTATAEECQSLEQAAVWSPEHVEDRLRDHFDGRPNTWVESLRPKPRHEDQL
jgi:hypothetical protein